MRSGCAILSVAVLCFGSLTQAGASTIYRCVEDGHVIYSDRPCGSDASAYEADPSRISILESAPAVATKPAKSRPKAKRAASADVSIAAAQAQHAQRCAALARSLRDIRSEMRAGYDFKQGERLRARQRKLVEQQRELKC